MANSKDVDIRHFDVILSPHITEKSTLLSEHNAVVFKVADTATKPQIKSAVESLFNVKVTGVNTIVTKGQDEALEGPCLQAQRCEKGDCHAGRRPVDRHHRRRAGLIRWHLKKLQSDKPWQARSYPRRQDRRCGRASLSKRLPKASAKQVAATIRGM